VFRHLQGQNPIIKKYSKARGSAAFSLYFRMARSVLSSDFSWHHYCSVATIRPVSPSKEAFLPLFLPDVGDRRRL
jgi:hypothetical protein